MEANSDPLWEGWSAFDEPGVMEMLERSYEKALEQGLTEEEALAALTEGMEAGNVRYAEIVRENALETMLEGAPRMIAEHNVILRGERRRLSWQWGEALDLLYGLLVAAREIGDGLERKLREDAGEDGMALTSAALVLLHARACLTASEIHALLSTGHGQGARARWRTLHETAVCIAVIGAAPPEIAERFLLHADVEAYKDARARASVAERNGWEPSDPKELAALKERRDIAVARYGQEFAGDWMWAAPLFDDPERVKPWMLEKYANLDHLRPFVRTANHLVHAGSSSAAFVQMNFRGYVSLLTGPTNVGLAEPGSATAVSLMQATTQLMLRGGKEYLSPRVLGTASALQDLTHEISAAFVRCEEFVEELERDVERAGTGRLAWLRLRASQFRRRGVWAARRLPWALRIRADRSRRWIRAQTARAS